MSEFKLRVGIPIDYSSYDMHAGGSFSYVTQLIAGIDNHTFPEGIEVIFLDYTGKAEIKSKKKVVSFHPFQKHSLSDRIRKITIELLKKLGKNFFGSFYNFLERKHAEKRSINIKKALIEINIHLILYVKPDGIDFNFPFVTIHWDIGHRSTYMFPEFGESFESRESYYCQTLNRALYILTETQTGKDELINFTSISENKIGVMPIFPGAVVNENVSDETQNEILKKAEITKYEFFIYPAQFWAHKNHNLLIEAMQQINKLYPRIKLILTGSNKGNLPYIEDRIKASNLKDTIKILGFVSNEELFTFYKNAIALVMPTFLGPSNMPPLEAATLACPVLISDLAGHRELMKDYATYFDPTNVDDLIEKMQSSIMNKTAKKFDSSNFNIHAAMLALQKSLLKIRSIRSTWGH
ncbi:glycosyltransferase family 4 protein [Pedobacter sp. KLB.chiD]|uniref:glycosyltransferase family 4 protein n=1 Tax=Pedobacter sp. KLB.chiD TaxID=3387402 RepID=UPI0039999E19